MAATLVSSSTNISRFKSSKVNCCVVGCSNSYLNSPEGTQFYSFYHDKRFPGRLQKWISAIKRQSRVDGKPWQPSKYTRICSVHFVGGKKSDHPLNPAFIPTLMPSVYKTKSVQSAEQTKRFERMNGRSKKVKITTEDICTDIDEIRGEKHDSAVQTCLTETPECELQRLSVLYCSNEGNNLSTQADIYNVHSPAQNCNSGKYIKPPTRNIRCGSDEVTNVGFQGHKDIENEDQLRGLTGVTFTVFIFFLSKMKNKVSKLTQENRLLVFLMKMKIGLTFAALGVLLGIHRTTASRIFFEVLTELMEQCCDIVFWPSRFAIRTNLPSVFSSYENIRAIIDCTEIPTERPPRVDNEVFVYSNYKGRFTLKFLIAITPNGFISFISKGYGGRATDAYITQNCGILQLLQPGDLVMADKGFPLIKTELQKNYIELVMPPFATKDQFTAKETEETYEIASVRIHVERIISRLKTYRILDKITVEMFPYIDAIVRMCCVLVNMQPPIIKSD